MYKKKLEKLAKGYKLTPAQIFILNCCADRESQDLPMPDMDDVLLSCNLCNDEAKQYYEKALDIYKKHVLVKTIVKFAVGFGLVVLVKRVLGITYATGRSDEHTSMLNKIADHAQKAAEEGKEGFDILRYQNNDDDTWNYVTASVRPNPIDENGY